MAYHKDSLRLAVIREQMGGIKAEDSTMWASAMEGIKALGGDCEAAAKEARA
ncbi:hypothetical protein [Geothrix campi]|uniref:hypothetical protein n=1 Tax=Geothrix campi TaxID=2966450 RepID=UPI002148B017|nr:hypothetical protein [Geothrix sp. SG10]